MRQALIYASTKEKNYDENKSYLIKLIARKSTTAGEEWRHIEPGNRLICDKSFV